MDAAVTDMAIGDGPSFWQRLRERVERGFEEGRDRGERHRNVRSVIRACPALRFDHRLAIEPQPFGLRLARRDRAVDDQFAGVLEAGFQHLPEVNRTPGRELHEHVDRVRIAERISEVGPTGEPQHKPITQDELEGGQEVATAPSGLRVESHHIVHRAQTEPGRLDLRWLREQLQRGSRHDAERPLGADEKLLEIVAAIVLAQGPQAVPDPSVGQNDFEAEHEVAGHAVAQDIEAPRIGGDIAADPRRTLEPKVIGRRQFSASAACFATSRIQPASTTITYPAGSTERTAFMRSSSRTTSGSFASDTAAPTRPVRPPCGTMPRLRSMQRRTTAAASSTVRGRATAKGSP